MFLRDGLRESNENTTLFIVPVLFFLLFSEIQRKTSFFNHEFKVFRVSAPHSLKLKQLFGTFSIQNYLI